MGRKKKIRSIRFEENLSTGRKDLSFDKEEGCPEQNIPDDARLGIRFPVELKSETNFYNGEFDPGSG